MTKTTRTEPNGLIIEEDKEAFVPVPNSQDYAMAHQVKFLSGNETFQFDFEYTGQKDKAGKDLVSNNFKFTYNGKPHEDLFALDKRFLPDDLFLQMAENFPSRNEQADVNKSLEYRLMKVDTSKLSEDKLRETKDRLQKISDKGHIGATVSLVNLLVDEYSALPEDKKVEKAALARKIVTLSNATQKGDKTGLCAPNLIYALQKNEEIAFLAGGIKKGSVYAQVYKYFKRLNSDCVKIGSLFLGKAQKGTNIQDEASAHNKRGIVGFALVGVPAAAAGIALGTLSMAAVLGVSPIALGGAIAVAAAGGAYAEHKEKIDGFLASAKKTLLGR